MMAMLTLNADGTGSSMLCIHHPQAADLLPKCIIQSLCSSFNHTSYQGACQSTTCISASGVDPKGVTFLPSKTGSELYQTIPARGCRWQTS